MYSSVPISCHQVHIGTALTMEIGVLRYSGVAGVIFGATVSAILVVTVLIATVACLVIVGCKQYKKRLSHAKAQNEQLEQEVINMESQVTMIHEQMKGMHTDWVHANHAHMHQQTPTHACKQIDSEHYVAVSILTDCIITATTYCNSN